MSDFTDYSGLPVAPYGGEDRIRNHGSIAEAWCWCGQENRLTWTGEEFRCEAHGQGSTWWVSP